MLIFFKNFKNKQISADLATLGPLGGPIGRRHRLAPGGPSPVGPMGDPCWGSFVGLSLVGPYGIQRADEGGLADIKSSSIITGPHNVFKREMRHEANGHYGSGIPDLTVEQKYCLQKFINLCMKQGKKNKAYKIISYTLRRLHRSRTSRPAQSEKRVQQALPKDPKSTNTGETHVSRMGRLTGDNPIPSNGASPALLLADPFAINLLMNAVDNVKPIIEIKKVRISGNTQLVPHSVPKNRQKCLAIRWIIEAAISRHNSRKSMTLDQCFFAELMDAYQNIGTVRKKRDDLHKLAEYNRGFAHYRWW